MCRTRHPDDAVPERQSSGCQESAAVVWREGRAATGAETHHPWCCCVPCGASGRLAITKAGGSHRTPAAAEFRHRRWLWLSLLHGHRASRPPDVRQCRPRVWLAPGRAAEREGSASSAGLVMTTPRRSTSLVAQAERQARQAAKQPEGQVPTWPACWKTGRSLGVRRRRQREYGLSPSIAPE